MRPQIGVPRLTQRPHIDPTWVSTGSYAADGRLACGEIVYWADDSVARAVRVNRVHRVIVGCVRLEIKHAHAEDRMRMLLFQSDVRFRRLAQIFGIRAVVHNAEVFV
jgi:hypothetical protein